MSSLKEAAISYALRGWRVFPLHSIVDGACTCTDKKKCSPGKHPRTLQGFKDATSDPKVVTKWWDRWPDANIGIACGLESGIWVLDVDPDHGGGASLDALAKEFGPLPATSRVITGSGGHHVYFACPDEPGKNHVGFRDGLDVRGEGAYVVAPPSNHLSGGTYVWEDNNAFLPVPGWLLGILGEKKLRGGAEESGTIEEGSRHDKLLSLGGSMRARGMSTGAIRAALHEENSTRTSTPLEGHEVDVIAESAGGYDPAEESFQVIQDGPRKGKRCVNQHNIRLALKLMEVKLAHDLFSSRLLANGNHLEDALIMHLFFEIERLYKFRVGKEYFFAFVEEIARENPFHPVRDYLNALVWDGVERVDGWMTKYAEVESSEYSRAVGKIFLVAAVRRVRRPGCKFDEMLVFESGVQGRLKSSLLETLAIKEEWFSDDMPLNADGKKFIEQTGGRWIIEAADLTGIRQSDVDALKATLSRRVDKARLSYERRPVEVPRQCVMVGTTNNDRYLRDGTGNRRFWPVAVGKIELEALIADRDQLWAEAAEIERRGFSIRLDPALYPDAGREQETRRVQTALEEKIEDIFGNREGRVRSASVSDALGLGRYDNTAVVRDAMKRVGWEKKRMRFADGSNANGFYRGTGKDEIRLSRQADGSVDVRVGTQIPGLPPF